MSRSQTASGVASVGAAWTLGPAQLLPCVATVDHWRQAGWSPETANGDVLVGAAWRLGTTQLLLCVVTNVRPRQVERPEAANGDASVGAQSAAPRLRAGASARDAPGCEATTRPQAGAEASAAFLSRSPQRPGVWAARSLSQAATDSTGQRPAASVWDLPPFLLQRLCSQCLSLTVSTSVARWTPTRPNDGESGESPPHPRPPDLSSWKFTEIPKFGDRMVREI